MEEEKNSVATKKTRFKIEWRTFLTIVVLILIIIGIGYHLLTPSNETRVLTVDEILTNTKIYLNKVVTVEGLYYISPDGPSVIKPSVATNPEGWLNLDLTQIENATANVIVDHKYWFTGVLKEVETASPTAMAVLVVTKITPV